MQVVFLSKMLYIIVRGQLWQEVALAHFYSIYNLWSQYQAVNLHKAVTLPFPVGDCLIQIQLYCPLSIAVHCLENKRKFLYQWNLLFYNSFLDVILPSMWIPQPESERVKNLPLIWLSSILLGMQRNTKMFRINFEKHASEVMILKKAQVQNPALYRTFTLQKQRMEGERRSNEQGLFLRIPRGKCQHINETGFCHFQKGGKNHFFFNNVNLHVMCAHI